MKAFIWDIFRVEGKLINFISLYPKGLYLILLKRTKEVEGEKNTKINLGNLIIKRYFGSEESTYYYNYMSKLSIYGLES